MTIEELKTLNIGDKVLYQNDVYIIVAKGQGNKHVYIEKGIQILKVLRTSLKCIK